MEPGLPDARSALFFDFDGTLVDLAPRADSIHMPKDVPALLGRIQRLLGGAVAVVSGRPMADVDFHLQPLKLCVAGVHGAERRDAEGHVVRLHTGNLEAAGQLLDAACREHAGLRLEIKPGALALHYRQAPQLEDLCQALMSRALDLTEGMALLRGKMVVELKPRHASKGLAVGSYLDEPPFRQRRPWFFGDDVTDESAFELVQGRGGVAVKVGAGETLAAHRLADPEALRAWLERACDPHAPPWRDGANP